MARLIEIPGGDALPASLTLAVGDVLAIGAAGGRVREGSDVVESLGAFVPGVVGMNGEVMAPTGAPSTVLFHARRGGRATIDLMQGDPWHSPAPSTLEVTVAE